MSDIVVSIRKDFWPRWIAEGDAAGDPATGTEWGYFIGGNRPDIGAGDRLYIVAHNRVRGYAPCTRLVSPSDDTGNKWVICREAGAVAITIPETVRGFQGFRKRWWDRSIEVEFPHWKTEDVVMPNGKPFRALQMGLGI